MLRRLRQTVFFAVLLFGFFSQAQSRSAGGFYFEETFFPVLTKSNDTGSVTPTSMTSTATESGTGYDSRTTLGYVFGSSFLVGVTYNLYSLHTERGNVEGVREGKDEKTNVNQFGPTLGWVGNNWRVLFTYFTSGKKSVDTVNKDNSGVIGDVSMTNAGMKGYQVLLGYDFNLTNNFALGPSIVYRNVSYSSQSKTNRLNSSEDYSDFDLPDAVVDSKLDAMVSLIFRF